jgi:hypothetical protein
LRRAWASRARGHGSRPPSRTLCAASSRKPKSLVMTGAWPSGQADVRWLCVGRILQHRSKVFVWYLGQHYSTKVGTVTSLSPGQQPDQNLKPATASQFNLPPKRSRCAHTADLLFHSFDQQCSRTPLNFSCTFSQALCVPFLRSVSLVCGLVCGLSSTLSSNLLVRACH